MIFAAVSRVTSAATRSASLLVAGWLAFSFAAGAADRSNGPIRWVPGAAGSNDTAVEVAVDERVLRALRPDWQDQDLQKLLSVYAGDSPNLPAMLGSYRLEKNVLRFRPTYPLEPGVTYRAVFRESWLPQGTADSSADLTATYRIPVTKREPTTTVAEVYPSAEVLPENLLKFYIHFSAPMRRGNSYEHVRLLDAAGKPVELPFLELDEELWNPEMTRLTLFIDPGRIKRGVRPLEETGPALEAGKRYTLKIDPGWLDHLGLPLREGFHKSFRVGAPDREPPVPANWRFQLPKAGTRDRLEVNFSKPMDQALALRMIQVVNAAGRVVEGTSALADHEQSWLFTPQESWKAGRYRLEVPNTIEDLAGNNIGKPFDVDLFGGVQQRFTNEVVQVPFDVPLPDR